jgi:putative transcriptional regulator
MPTVKSLKRPSKSSKRPAASKARTPFAAGLLRGIEEATEHFRGQRTLASYEYHIPDHIDVRALRESAGLSQAEFAGRYALNPRTVQEWEQGRAEPDGAVRAYLTVIRENPRAVEEALAAATEK